MSRTNNDDRVLGDDFEPNRWSNQRKEKNGDLFDRAIIRSYDGPDLKHWNKND